MMKKLDCQGLDNTYIIKVLFKRMATRSDTKKEEEINLLSSLVQGITIFHPLFQIYLATLVAQNTSEFF